MKTEEEGKLKAMLKDPEHQSNFDLLRQHGKENQSKWEHEIAMLERRVKEETAKVDLGNGDKLEIRSCLSDAEMEEFGRLQTLVQTKGKGKDNSEASYKMLEMTTANPLLTAEWFKQNRDKYATADMAAVLIGFYEDRVKRQKAGIDRVKSAADFRTD